MDMIIESTKNFEQDLETFIQVDREIIIDQLNKFFPTFSTDKASFYRRLYRFPHLKLINDYEASLYSLSITPKIRVILTIDEDPIFEQTIITLFRVVNHSELEQAYNSVAESLYQNLILSEQKIEATAN